MRNHLPAAVILFILASFPLMAETPQGKHYIENGRIKVGVDLDSGGGIFLLSDASTERNVLNHKDKGRLIQQSYYGTPDGSMWEKIPWRWNPVQGGNYKGDASRIIEFRQDANSLYVKTQPRQWAGLGLVDDVIMEETITLEGDVASIHFVCTYSGTTQHPVTHQETPAVFVDGALPILQFYQGDKPWQNEKLTSARPSFPNEFYKTPENWAAYTDENGWGVGVYVPDVSEITAYCYKGAETTGPEGDACSYFAPIRSFSFDKPTRFEYTAYLTIGDIAKIRARFDKIRKTGTAKGLD